MRKLSLVGFLVILLACEGEKGEIGETGANSLLNLIDEPAGENCPSGGYRIEVGIDVNNNGILENGEVESTQYLCNGDSGADGLNSLVDVMDEPAGENCSAGGVKIEEGIDVNENGILDEDEVQITQFVCNGASEKEISIDFGLIPNPDNSSEGKVHSNNIEGKILDEKRCIRDFDIRNYLDVDSVSFSAYLMTQDSNVKCIAELFNVTDNAVIAGSEISSNRSGSFELVLTSHNFIENIPNKPIVLGLRLRPEQDNTYVSMTNPMVTLYRNSK